MDDDRNGLERYPRADGPDSAVNLPGMARIQLLDILHLIFVQTYSASASQSFIFSLQLNVNTIVSFPHPSLMASRVFHGTWNQCNLSHMQGTTCDGKPEPLVHWKAVARDISLQGTWPGPSLPKPRSTKFGWDVYLHEDLALGFNPDRKSLHTIALLQQVLLFDLVVCLILLMVFFPPS
ncbi:hypothetical protein IW261DRAFT_1555373 [Armillaria novae-zelandiae]|uniref:Uncharacterized protein n=1 Tax=Armillaria novae-zelandiae TaxID=153914 RepID=A0AA39URW8_9AGAR|nr:hypothetical protein IW261DRAFT_1555373 [Armillaria novae-zelandiae]